MCAGLLEATGSPLELELLAIESYQVGAANRLKISARAASALNPRP